VAGAFASILFYFTFGIILEVANSLGWASELSASLA
jgi:hypothetical protein